MKGFLEGYSIMETGRVLDLVIFMKKFLCYSLEIIGRNVSIA